MRDVLGVQLGDTAAFYYGVTDEGNVPAAQDLRGELKGRNVLSVRRTIVSKCEPEAGPCRPLPRGGVALLLPACPRNAWHLTWL